VTCLTQLNSRKLFSVSFRRQLLKSLFFEPVTKLNKFLTTKPIELLKHLLNASGSGRNAVTDSTGLILLVVFGSNKTGIESGEVLWVVEGGLAVAVYAGGVVGWGFLAAVAGECVPVVVGVVAGGGVSGVSAVGTGGGVPVVVGVVAGVGVSGVPEEVVPMIPEGGVPGVSFWLLSTVKRTLLNNTISANETNKN
jgi:hypothetical protein